MKKITIVTLLLALCAMGAFPATVDTINVLSEKMGKEIKTVVINRNPTTAKMRFPCFISYTDTVDNTMAGSKWHPISRTWPITTA